MCVCEMCLCVRTPGEGCTAAKAAKSCEVASFFCPPPPTPRWGDEIFTTELGSSADGHVARKRKENADFQVVCRFANTHQGTRLFFLCLCLFCTWGPLQWQSHCLPGQLHRPPPGAPPRRPQPSEAERQSAVSKEFKGSRGNWRV